MKRTVAVIAALIVVGLFLGGCASPEQRAQKLFEQGKYEEILAKYPDQPIAKQAKDKVAEKLVQEGKYEEVLANYSDTPSAAEATNKIAEKMVADKKYEEVLVKYPNTPAANMARNAIADQLYNDKKLDELINKGQVAPAGSEERRNLFRAAFKRIHEELIADVMLFHMVGYSRVGKRINFKPSLATNNEIPLAQITFK
jgi:hypothetical protein